MLPTALSTHADVEVYKPEQVTVDGGAAVLTIERLPDGETATAPVQQASGEIQDVSKQFKSGMLQGWSKFCYTGEGVVRGGCLLGNQCMPGDTAHTGRTPGDCDTGTMLGAQGRTCGHLIDCWLESLPMFWSVLQLPHPSPARLLTCCACCCGGRWRRRLRGGFYPAARQ